MWYERNLFKQLWKENSWDKNIFFIHEMICCGTTEVIRFPIEMTKQSVVYKVGFGLS